MTPQERKAFEAMRDALRRLVNAESHPLEFENPGRPDMIEKARAALALAEGVDNGK